MHRTRYSPDLSGDEAPLSRSRRYRANVLVVDDESTIANTLAEILTQSGYAAIAAYDGDSALESALLSPPHLLITDVVLPGMNGIELATTIKRVYPDCKILLFSGQTSAVDLLTAAHHTGHRFTLLDKPIPPAELLAAVEEHLKETAPRLDLAAN
jgi:DNA-binding response OmpR family regulator